MENNQKYWGTRSRALSLFLAVLLSFPTFAAADPKGKYNGNYQFVISRIVTEFADPNEYIEEVGEIKHLTVVVVNFTNGKGKVLSAFGDAYGDRNFTKAKVSIDAKGKIKFSGTGSYLVQKYYPKRLFFEATIGDALLEGQTIEMLPGIWNLDLAQHVSVKRLKF